MLPKRNLVLGAIRGYNYEHLRPFIVSLKRTGFDGDLVFFWNNLSPETLTSLKEQGVKLVHFSFRSDGLLNSWSRFWPLVRPVARRFPGSFFSRRILRAMVHLLYARFFICHDFLSEHKNEYGNVLITDVRDVIFQANPFSGFEGGLLAFEEDGRLSLADEKMCNAGWLEETFGTEALNRIGQHPIICAGTTMGDVPSMLRYLVEYEKQMCQVKAIANGGDQGIHNFLCRTTTEPWLKVSKNGEGPVLTMVPTIRAGVDFQVSVTGAILGLDGRKIPVLHQYDRHPEIASTLLRNLNEPAVVLNSEKESG